MESGFFTLKIFGENNKKVIFFFAGMGTRTWLYKGPIKRLVQNGFRVYAYDFDPLIVRNGNPDQFLEAGEKVSRSVFNAMNT